MPKTEFDYESKQLARQKLANFIIKHYSKDERKNLKMACLPGAQALDVYNVSDVLSIPRKNVTGIEKDKKIFKGLQEKNLGINLFYGTDREFFESADKRYDIISLDYFGMFTNKISETFQNSLFGRQVLNSPGILNTNFFGAREADSVKRQYAVPFLCMLEAQRFYDMEEMFVKSNGEPQDFTVLQSEQTNTDFINNLPMKILRNGITKSIIQMARVGTSTSKTTEDEAEYFHERIFPYIMDCDIRGIPRNIAFYALIKNETPYFCEDVESYKYRSDVGSPMYTDLFFFNQHRECFDEKTYPICLCKDESSAPYFMIGDQKVGHEMKINPLVNKCLRKADEVAQMANKSSKKTAIRIDIGSSFKPLLSKKNAIALLKEGKDVKWIAENFRGDATNPNTLRAYKAWITMGKY